MSRFVDTFFFDELKDKIIKKFEEIQQKSLEDRKFILSVGESWFTGKKLDSFIDNIATAIKNSKKYSFLFAYYIPSYEQWWGKAIIDKLIRNVLEQYDKVCYWGISIRFIDYFQNYVNEQSVLIDSYKHGDYINNKQIVSPDYLKLNKVDVIVITSTFREEIMQTITNLGVDAVVL